jgi:hypothetical protein
VRPAAITLGWLGVATLSCASIDPEVGASQESCGVEPLGATTTTSTSTIYGASGGVTSTPTTCEADAGSACDECESERCCATRLPCYEDPVCVCQDHVLDACVAAAGSDSAEAGECWTSFTNAGAVEAARVACEIAWCKAVCGIP